MRKILLSLAVLLCTAWAGAIEPDRAAFPATGQLTKAPTRLTSGTVYYNADGALSTPASEAGASKASKAKPRKISGVADLVGDYAMTYETFSSKSMSGGTSVSISKLSDDSIAINNFFLSGSSVHAAVDAQAGTFSIPCQAIGTYGNVTCDLSSASVLGKVDRTALITGTIDAQGNLSIDGYWGLFPNTGTSTVMNRFSCLYGNTVIAKANAKMDVTYTATSGREAETWNVVATQTGANVLSVVNFGNHGETVEIVLGSDKTISIKQQLVYQGGSTEGNYYTAAANWSTSSITSATITGTGTDNTVSWGPWVMASSAGYYTGQLASAKITTDNTIVYPSPASTSFEGSGTEADPYLIKTLADLNLMAATVNADTELNYDVNGTKVTRTYLGKYFKVANDIDMANYRFEPIGNYYTQRFAGTFDGNGKTIKGLNVNTRLSGFAGLFGVADSTSVIKNLNLADVNVSAQYYYAGGLAGADYGTIENVTVTGSVSNSGLCAGGIVAYGMNVSDCYFNGTINATGGVGGGIAGQINGTLKNSHARASVYGNTSSSSSTLGGVVGTVYGVNASVRDSYFTGVVSAAASSARFHTGGVVGEVVAGTVDGTFAAANVLANQSTTYPGYVGGVSGSTLGGTIANSYSTGNVNGRSVSTSGGIVGYVSGTMVGTDTLQSTIKNCYFAGQLLADTYLYDTANGMRETLGSIATGAHPTVENVYYDCQIINFNSVNGRATTAQLTSASGPAGFPADRWTFAEGYYPRIKGLENTEEAQLSASVLQFDPGFPDNVNRVSTDFPINALGSVKGFVLKGYETSHATISNSGYTGNISNSVYKLNGEFGNDTITLVAMNADGSMNGAIQPRIIPIKVAPKVFDGVGSKTDPYQIKTKADLILLSQITTGKRQFYPETYFLQTADIDMELDTAFLGICNSYVDLTDKFAGHYDGGNHTIHNLKLHTVAWSVAPTETALGTILNVDNDIYKGFIGSLAADGSISNLTLAADCDLQFAGYSGAFVGYCFGTVDNCRNYANVTTYRTTTGGIVGATVSGAVIKNCYNAGNVTVGGEAAGGIVGDLQSATLENCQNVGMVAVKVLSKYRTSAAQLNNAGGIAGRSTGSTITNVVNAGHVSVGGDAAGGIIGLSNSSGTVANNIAISGAVNYGTVFGSKPAGVGAVEGKGANAGEKKNNYFDEQVAGIRAFANDSDPNEKGLNTSELISGTALEGLGTDVFSFAAGRYPVLKLVESDEKALRAASTIIGFADGEASRRFRTKASLASGEGITWTLDNGTKFSIADNQLVAPDTIPWTLTDTITATNGDYVKPVALAAVIALDLNGSGTETDPYQLASLADWNTLSHYIEGGSDDLGGRYVKVMNDIDFAGEAFAALGYDGITPFAGILDGNGKTIKGINVSTNTKNYGVIQTLGTGGVVKDLTLEGMVKSTTTYVGGFTGSCNGELNNCVSNLTVSGTGRVGGFAENAGRNALFVKCVNKGTVSSTGGYVAGFVAEQTATGARFVDCTNEAEIKSTGTASYVAGFVGYGKGGVTYERCANVANVSNASGTIVAGIQAYCTAATDSVVLIDTYNSGDITATDCAAGLTAQITATTNLIASGCYNTGVVSTTGSKGSYHGTAGLFAYQTGASRVVNCYNTGNVSAAKSAYTGGISAQTDGAKAEATGLISGCYNTGEIVGANYGGGIVGSLKEYMAVTDCYNRGSVTAAIYAGGVVASFMGNRSTLDNSWNSGSIHATTRTAGGIANVYGIYSGTVTNCFNVGSVVSDGKYAGGFAGAGRGVFYNCYNRGDVKGASSVGGMVGEPAKLGTIGLATSFYNCYTVGKVEGTSLVGNIIGDGSYWDPTTGNTAQNAYYVTDFQKFDSDTIGTASTVAELAAIKSMGADAADVWTYGDEYTFPVLTQFADSAAARAYAVAVVLNPADTYASVVNNANVGVLDGVAWSSESQAVRLSGNACNFVAGSTGEVVVKATCGDFVAPWTLVLNNTTAVSDVNVDRAVVAETYYNTAGVKVAKPESADGQIYIVVRTYDDGTTQSVKVQNK